MSHSSELRKGPHSELESDQRRIRPGRAGIQTDTPSGLTDVLDNDSHGMETASPQDEAVSRRVTGLSRTAAISIYVYGWRDW